MNKTKNGRTAKAGKKIPAKKIDSELVLEKHSTHSFYVVCIGASAGGLNAIMELVSQLPAKLNAAVFIVLHFSAGALGEILVQRIKLHSTFTCSIAKDGEPVRPGRIYVAVPDAHLLIKDHIILGRGPAENRFRPSIDVLFKSAAAYYNSHTIGIVLTGLLNDGTSGMWAIKQSGGHCIVQDPNEAEYPDMPLSVLETVQVDYSVPLNEIGTAIGTIVNGKNAKDVLPPPEIVAESRLSEKAATAIEEVEMLGEKSLYACPDCGGNLWEIKNGKLKHYRCHIGHTYSEDDLILKQTEGIEQTVWVAVRMMEERKLLLTRLARENSHKGLQKLGTSYREYAAQLESHIKKMKELLFSMQKN